MAINNIFLGTTNTDIIVSAANEAITATSKMRIIIIGDISFIVVFS